MADEAQALRMTADGLGRRATGGPDEASVLERMAAMLGACSKARPGSPEFALQVEREAFRRQFGAVSLPDGSGEDGGSLVLLGGDLGPAVAMVQSLAPILADAELEILVADQGRDPRTRLLAMHIQGLRVISAGDAVSACNLAVAAARGSRIAILSGPVEASDPMPPKDVAWVGSAGSFSLARWGVMLPVASMAKPGLAIATARADWLAAGGLDPLMEDGDGLEIADLALRLHQSGIAVLSCGASEPWTRRPHDQKRQWQCIHRFRARWGDRPNAALGLA